MDVISNKSCSDLSRDNIFEILTRVSLETLRWCKFVCKEWRRLTHESIFTSLHCERTQTMSGYFIQSIKEHKYFPTFVSISKSPLIPHLSLDFLPDEVKIEASSNQGLLYCMSNQSGQIPRYYICKPTTQEWSRIPNPNMQSITEKTAIVVRRSNPLHYNIFRFLQPNCGRHYTLRCEIFDSKHWAWKRSTDVKLYDADFLLSRQVVLANGAFHMLTYQQHILAFNINRESWKRLPLPQEVLDANENYHSTQLVEYEGQLALLHTKNDWIEIWVMVDYFNEIWEKRQRVNMEALKEEECHSVVASLYTSDIALVKGLYKVIWYNCQNYTTKSVKIDKHFYSRDIYAFQSDMEPCNLKNIM